MEEDEKDIEMGNAGMKEHSEQMDGGDDGGNDGGDDVGGDDVGGGGGGGSGSSYLCCSENESDAGETSSMTSFPDMNMKPNKYLMDEDDLGDNEDELHQSRVTLGNNIIIDRATMSGLKTRPKKKENVGFFDINKEFLKIIDRAGSKEEEGGEGDAETTENGNYLRRATGSVSPPNADSEDIILHNIEDFWEANSESEDEDYLDKNAKHALDQISFEKLKKKVYKDFEVTLIHRYSSALDILASYIKYHVIIYTEASYYCNFKLNLFMVPAILFSTICSVITGITHNRDNMAIIVASLNGFIAFLLAIINYLKLDASAEAHKISAYQYSKLKNYIEFSSGEILLFQDPIITNKNFISEQIKVWEKSNEGVYSNEQIYNTERNKKLKEYHKYKSHLEKKLIDTIQNKIFEIKKSLKNIEDNNNFILPKHINRRYYNIYNINVFSYIKSVENYKLVLLNDLRNVKNELRFYRTIDQPKIPDGQVDKIKRLYNRKNSILTEFLELNKGFMLIDAMFQQEIKNINIRKKYWVVFKFQGFVKLMLRCCCCKKTNFNILPVGYKHCTHVGFVDEDGRYLLDKVLRFNNVLTLIE